METRRTHRKLYDDLAVKLKLWEDHYGDMPGITDHDYRKTFIEQIISSLRRIEYITQIQNRSIDPERSNPHSPLFDPLRSAILMAKKGDTDEAIWTVFIATHFGRHIADGWKLAANVYGSFGEGPTWSSDTYRADKKGFEAMLQKNLAKLQDKHISGRYSNHRQYQSKNPISIATTFRTFSEWQFSEETFAQKIRGIHKKRAKTQKRFLTSCITALKASLDLDG